MTKTCNKLNASRKKWVGFKRWGLLLLMFSALPSPVWGRSLSGIATIEWKTGKRTYLFDQAILIEKDKATFETVDDFGNSVFKLRLNDRNVELGKEKNKILSLKMTSQELISYLLYEIPKNNKNLNVQTNSKGWVTIKAPTYTICFFNWQKRNTINFPNKLEIRSGKTILTITWQSVTLI